MLKNMKKQYRVMYDSLEETFLVHREAAGLLLFKEHGNGLHFFDSRQADFAFVETMESNMRLYSKRQVACTDKARSLYASLEFPSQKDFMWILRSNQIKDSPSRGCHGGIKNMGTKCGSPEREDGTEEAGARQN
jgi:hypothetical protein